MSARTDALSAARLLLRASKREDGAIDGGKAKDLVRRIGEARPRNHLLILDAFCRLLRLELEAREARIESAVELSSETRESLESDLVTKYGNDINFHYATNPDLLGGLRIRVGSDVWDGTVKSRLDRLSLAFS